MEKTLYRLIALSTITLLLSCYSPLSGQSYSARVIKSGVLENANQVSIQYLIEPYIPGQVFKVEVFCSHDNYKDLLIEVRGNVGMSVASQQEPLEIIWDFTNEFRRNDITKEQYQIRITRVGGENYVPSVVVSQGGKKVRIGSPLTVKLAEYPQGVDYRLTLSSQEEGILKTVDLEGKKLVYKWDLQKSLSPGKTYTVSLTSLPVFDGSITGVSNTFQAVKRPPSWIWAFTAFPVAAGVWFALNPRGDLPTPPSTTDLDPFK